MQSSLFLSVVGILAGLLPGTLHAFDDYFFRQSIAPLYQNLKMDIPSLDEVPPATPREREAMIRSMRELIPARTAANLAIGMETDADFKLYKIRKGYIPLMRRTPPRPRFDRAMALAVAPLENALASPDAPSWPAAYRESLDRMVRLIREAMRVDSEWAQNPEKANPFGAVMNMMFYPDSLLLSEELSFLERYFFRETGMPWDWEAERVRELLRHQIQVIECDPDGYPTLAERAEALRQADGGDAVVEQSRLYVNELITLALDTVRRDDLRPLTIPRAEREGIHHYLNSLLLERKAWQIEQPSQITGGYWPLLAASGFKPDTSRLPEDTLALLDRVHARRAELLPLVEKNVEVIKKAPSPASNFESVEYKWIGSDEDKQEFQRQQKALRKLEDQWDALINLKTGLTESLYVDLMSKRLGIQGAFDDEQLLRQVWPHIDDTLLSKQNRDALAAMKARFESLCGEELREYVKRDEAMSRQERILSRDVWRYLINRWKKEGLPEHIRELPDRMVADRLRYPDPDTRQEP